MEKNPSDDKNEEKVANVNEEAIEENNDNTEKKVEVTEEAKVERMKKLMNVLEKLDRRMENNESNPMERCIVF